MSDVIVSVGRRIREESPHVKNKDFYWEVVDHDGDPDGYIHIVSTRDGSELRLLISAVLDALGIDQSNH